MAAYWPKIVTWPISSHLALQVIIHQPRKLYFVLVQLNPPVSNYVTMELHLVTIWSTNAAKPLLSPLENFAC